MDDTETTICGHQANPFRTDGLRQLSFINSRYFKLSNTMKLIPYLIYITVQQTEKNIRVREEVEVLSGLKNTNNVLWLHVIFSFVKSDVRF